MIDIKELEWGLRPFREINALAICGARTLFQEDRIEFLHDRQSNLGSAPACEALHSWLNGKAVPALKEHIVKQGWTWNTEETFTLETWSFLFEASPRSSGGYIYLSAYLKGLEKFPEGKWSGTFIPEIGEKIVAAVNGIGESEVLGYYLQAGWIGVIALPNNPPEWFVKQNGKNAVCGLFGAEIRKL